MKIYILQNNQKQGPYSIEELKSKNISAETMIWAVGLSDWQPAKEVPELAELLSQLPPDPPPPTQPMPKTWLIESILVTCLCCLPFGIIGIINATKIETLYVNGSYDEAVYRSKQAKKWALAGFFTFLIGWILYLLIILITVLFSLNMSL